MMYIFTKIKKIIIYMIRLILALFSLNKLSFAEQSGQYKTLSSLKFTRKNIIELPFDLGLTIRGVCFTVDRSESPDGFIRALRIKDRIIDEGHFLSTMISIFMKERDLSIGDFYNGINDVNVRKLPLYCFSYPWESLTIFERAKLYPSLVNENRRQFFDFIMDDLYDISHIRSHFIQFSQLFDSIVQNGLYKTQDPPKVYILKKGNQWKWIMSGNGNHRVYCAHLLGKKSVSVCIEAVIDVDRLDKISIRLGHKFSRQELYDIFNIVWQGKYCVRGMI
jgi:hypothetical protein